jgi:hypothetical protein
MFSRVIGLFKEGIRKNRHFFKKKKTDTRKASESIGFWVSSPNLILYRPKRRDPRTLSSGTNQQPLSVTNITQKYYQTKLNAQDLLTTLEKLSFNQWNHLQNILTYKYHSYPSITPSVYLPTIRERYEKYDTHNTYLLNNQTILTHKESTQTKQKQEIEKLKKEILIWKTFLPSEAQYPKFQTLPTTVPQKTNEKKQEQDTNIRPFSPTHLRQIYDYQEKIMRENFEFERLRRGL